MLIYNIIIHTSFVLLLTFFGIGIWKMFSENMRELREKFNKEGDSNGHSHA